MNNKLIKIAKQIYALNVDQQIDGLYFVSFSDQPQYSASCFIAGIAHTQVYENKLSKYYVTLDEASKILNDLEKAIVSMRGKFIRKENYKNVELYNGIQGETDQVNSYVLDYSLKKKLIDQLDKMKIIYPSYFF